jgi:hypothetical protein
LRYPHQVVEQLPLLLDLDAGRPFHLSERPLDPRQIPPSLSIDVFDELGSAQREFLLLASFTLTNEGAYLLQEGLIIRT